MGEIGEESVRRALVVDDEPDERELVGALLESAGFVVHRSASADAALAALRTLRPEVVLIDLQLGADSGVELAKRVRASPGLAPVALIAITGRVEPEWKVVEPFDAYVRKPVDPVLLVRASEQLSDVVRGASSPRDTAGTGT